MAKEKIEKDTSEEKKKPTKKTVTKKAKEEPVVVIKEVKENVDVESEFVKEEVVELKPKNVALSFSGTEIVIVVIIATFVGLVVGLIISKPNTSKSLNSLSPAMQNFSNEYKEIIDNYYDEVDEEKVLDKALEAVIGELGDPYSEIIDESFSNSLETRLKGSYSGFGIEIVNDNDMNIVITGILDNSPAEKAKLKAGDIIISVDGVSVKGKTTTDFVGMVKEKKQQTVELKILRNNKELSFSLKRDLVTIKSVTSKIIEKNDKKVGYMYINVFASNTDTQFASELKDLEKKGIDSLIIDVRSNSGGHLSAVDNMLGEFFNKKTVIYQIEEKGKKTKYYSKGNETKKYDIVLLGDGGSASASEILISSLTEQYGAKFVGNKTYGKGTVQEVLTTGKDIQYKMTTKKWLTPKGIWIHEKGIKPDYEVELGQKYYDNPSDETDSQLQKALELLTK